MTDHFALLNEPRRPWLDAELLKARFFELSAELHPDRVHGAAEEERQRVNQRFLELNSAYNCLREPKSRLRHLLELESGAKPKEVQEIPADTMELFLETGQLCRQVDAFLAERAQVTSPLLKVKLFERAQEWTEQLNGAQQTINGKLARLDAELKEMNSAAGPLPWQRLERAYRDFSYLGRWAAQIQERVAQLSF
jgi:DnaJ-domain-containing protein 1